MYLEYIWINKFRIIENLGFNFSTERIYNYDEKTKRLEIKDNPKYLRGFFGDHISEVTALIGRNGVGKSSLFEFIIRNLSNFRDGGGEVYDDGDFFAVFNKLILVRNTSLITNSDELISSGFRIFDYEDTFNLFIEETTPYERTEYGKLTYVYYSNVFDYSISFDRPFNLCDVSTNYLLGEDSFTENEPFDFSQYGYKEIQRQINGIADINLEVPFTLPEEIFIEIFNYALSYKHKIDIEEFTEKGLKNIVSFIDTGFPDENIESAKLQVFINLLKIRSYKHPEIYKEIEVETFQNLFYDEIIDNKKITPQQKEELERIKRVMENLKNVLNSGFLNVEPKENNIQLTYQLQKVNTVFYNFLSSLCELMGVDSFFNIYWRGISSGEKAFLSLIGRLNYTNKYFESNFENEIKSVILLIDETDLYMHPEWQRTYFDILLKNLPRIFKQIKVQLILSTHSPFIASDLPKQNIIFLNKKSTSEEVPREICTIDEISMDNTFGANIYSLLADSFFLNNGFVGEFAKSKITKLFDDLSDNSDKLIGKDNTNILNLKDYNQLIQIIGEPVIKQKLQEILYEKRLAFSLEEQLEKKRNELKEIEEKIRKRNEKG